ncbi:hypothetical protein [Gluconobacter frateurii]|uniref:Uncharacterized protein n=1 Tax=Gluconobacter frateurii NRIC 0228 TaxID=1307946 RepID=A0ABQ0QDC6_9PROT|nr:hypothetical protein [Gluconobacter frateurii]GBR14156.1 hypothetical protein AA0228_2189 [Gluconobacter frateurii NRIC 0228]GLP92019.1 hypothetical protein GCM10007868_30940 [Gluconobacter frateurii]
MKIRFLAVAIACVGFSSTAFADEVCPIEDLKNIKSCDDYIKGASIEKMLCTPIILNNNPKDFSGTSFETRMAFAMFQNKYAQYVLDHKCPVQAKKLFIEVIETYTGSAYEAARQRAMIGIQDSQKN